MKRTILQIPMNSNLKSDIETIAIQEGFDSVQAFTRFVYTKIINREVSIPVISHPVEYISEDYEKYLNNREVETLIAIKAKKAYAAKSGEEFLNQIESKDERD